MAVRFGVGLPGPFSVGGSVSSRDVDDFWGWFWSWVVFLLIIAYWIVYWLVRAVIAIVRWSVRAYAVRKAARLSVSTVETGPTVSPASATQPRPVLAAVAGVNGAPGTLGSAIPTMPGFAAIVDELTEDGSRPGAAAAQPQAADVRPTSKAAAEADASAAQPQVHVKPVSSRADSRRLVGLSQKRGLVIGLIAFAVAVVSSTMMLVGVINQSVLLLAGYGVLTTLLSGVLAILAIVHSGIAIKRARAAGLQCNRPIGLPLGIVAFVLPGISFIGSALIVGIIGLAQRALA